MKHRIDNMKLIGREVKAPREESNTLYTRKPLLYSPTINRILSNLTEEPSVIDGEIKHPGGHCRGGHGRGCHTRSGHDRCHSRGGAHCRRD